MNKKITVYLILLVVLALVGGCGLVQAQVTNLLVNNSSSPTTMMSGDTLRWLYDLPVGGTALVRIWFDANNNGVLDTASDLNIFTFNQIDGDSIGVDNGPPDLDKTANGQIIFYQRVGLWAGTYFFTATNNGVGMTGKMTVTPLSPVVYTISGHVVPPAGKSAKDIVMELSPESNGGSNIFWDDLTDSLGNFSIKMDGDTGAYPWKVRINGDPFPGAVQEPTDTVVPVTTNPTGITFTFTQSAAKVTGLVKDDSGNLLNGVTIALSAQNVGPIGQSTSNSAGFFEIGLTTANLSQSPFSLQSYSNNGPVTTTTMQAQLSIPSINPGDSLFRVLTIYSTNATIRGQVTVNGGPPNASVTIVANNADSAQSVAMSDSATGLFSIPVSTKISSYQVFVINAPFSGFPSPVTASAGDSTVVLNFVVSAVKGQAKGLPLTYSLGQNYPNPWNPTTTITYALPAESRVTLRVYNLLGQLVATLADGVQSAGYRVATWNGMNVSSGVYFYRLDAVTTGTPLKTFTQIKKMLLVK